MIRELGKGTRTDWNEKLNIEMTLQDLQILYDCIGAVPTKYLEEKHKNTIFNTIINQSYSCEEITNDLYESLYTIVSRHNGVVDDNQMVNINVELSLKYN